MLCVYVFVGGFVLFFLFMFVVVKKDDKKKEEYRKQYVVQHTITDTYFGELECEWDKNKNELVCHKISKMFGKDIPKLTIENYDEKRNQYYLDALKTVYEHQEEVVRKLLIGLQGLIGCGNFDEKDKKEIETHFHINHMGIRERGEYFLEEEFLLDEYVEGIKLSDALFPYGDTGQEISPNALILVLDGSLDTGKISRSIEHYIGSIRAYMDCETKSMCYVIGE